MKKILAVCLAVLMLAGTMTSCGSKMFMATGSETGTYYAFGIVLADEIKNAAGIEIGVQSSGASKANIQLIDDETVDFAIVQNDVMDYAYNGTNTFAADGAITSFAAIATMYAEVVQIGASPDITSVADLVGKRVSVGDVGSGVVTNAEQILAAAGLSFDDISVQNLGVGPSADAIKAGTLDAFFFTAGIPTTAITELDTSNTEMVAVSIPDDQIAALTAQYPHYVRAEITNAHYPNSIAEGAPAVTIAVKATYIAAADLDEDLVYAMTKALWENQAAIASAHATGKAMDIKTALLGIGVAPVHAGAFRRAP